MLKATVGNGKSVHAAYIRVSEDKVINGERREVLMTECGAEGDRWANNHRSSVRPSSAEEVTCKRCLRSVESRKTVEAPVEETVEDREAFARFIEEGREKLKKEGEAEKARQEKNLAEARERATREKVLTDKSARYVLYGKTYYVHDREYARSLMPSFLGANAAAETKPRFQLMPWPLRLHEGDKVTELTKKSTIAGFTVAALRRGVNL